MRKQSKSYLLLLVALMMALTPLPARAEAASTARPRYVVLVDRGIAADGEPIKELRPAVELLGRLMLVFGETELCVQMVGQDAAAQAAEPPDATPAPGASGGTGGWDFAGDADAFADAVDQAFRAEGASMPTLEDALLCAGEEGAGALLVAANRPDGVKEEAFFSTAVGGTEQLVPRFAGQALEMMGYELAEIPLAAGKESTYEYTPESDTLVMLRIPGASGRWGQPALDNRLEGDQDASFALETLSVVSGEPLAFSLNKSNLKNVASGVWVVRPQPSSLRLVLRDASNAKRNQAASRIGKMGTLRAEITGLRGQMEIALPVSLRVLDDSGKPAEGVVCQQQESEGATDVYHVTFPSGIADDVGFTLIAEAEGAAPVEKKITVFNQGIESDAQVFAPYRDGVQLVYTGLLEPSDDNGRVLALGGLFYDPDGDEVRYRVDPAAGDGAVSATIDDVTGELTLRAQRVGYQMFTFTGTSADGSEITAADKLLVLVKSPEGVRTKYMLIGGVSLLLAALCFALILLVLRKKMMRDVAWKNVGQDAPALEAEGEPAPGGCEPTTAGVDAERRKKRRKGK